MKSVVNFCDCPLRFTARHRKRRKESVDESGRSADSIVKFCRFVSAGKPNPMYPIGSSTRAGRSGAASPAPAGARAYPTRSLASPTLSSTAHHTPTLSQNACPRLRSSFSLYTNEINGTFRCVTGELGGDLPNYVTDPQCGYPFPHFPSRIPSIRSLNHLPVVVI